MTWAFAECCLHAKFMSVSRFLSAFIDLYILVSFPGWSDVISPVEIAAMVATACGVYSVPAIFYDCLYWAYVEVMFVEKMEISKSICRAQTDKNPVSKSSIVVYYLKTGVPPRLGCIGRATATAGFWRNAGLCRAQAACCRREVGMPTGAGPRSCGRRALGSEGTTTTTSAERSDEGNSRHAKQTRDDSPQRNHSDSVGSWEGVVRTLVTVQRITKSGKT